MLKASYWMNKPYKGSCRLPSRKKTMLKQQKSRMIFESYMRIVKGDDVCCVHPGGNGISGYDSIMKSWKIVWMNFDFPLEIKLKNVRVHVRGDFGATNQNITDQSSRIDEIIRLKCGGSTHEVRIIEVEPSVLSKNALHEGQKVNS
ncbi:hypothetical protein GOBAR_DD22460 [Gossypium barbadense]|nr:hypothetical protein GOBAR_DD22460 [Gossypium barbadense]